MTFNMFSMDPTVKMKDLNCNATPANSDSFSIMPLPHHELVSVNSIELNAAASLSDDSGVPLTTNSSISSGDSYRLGMCKFIESDGEVSQFDSLDNCSEGGMSAENFNTLKKGPLAPIDPPPEFQDSPQTTLMRSLSKNVVHSLRRWTSSQSSFEHLKDHSNDADVIGGGAPLLSICPNSVVGGSSNTDDCLDADNGGDGMTYISNDDNKTLKDSYAINKHLYSSDSILNSHTDNIYDEPNNILSTSLGNSVDVIDSDSSSPLPPPPPPVSIVKIKQTLCPYYQDHTRYFKAIPSEQDNMTAAAQRFNLSGLSEIHDYDLYYGAKRNTYQQYDNSLQRRILYSPLNHSHHCHHYHAGMSGSGPRPNSRNSLNSRLSSSHNSLSVSSANKPDDSIFITQAMSHDALLTREISDFYNVPIDSDIYAFPVDMIQTASDSMEHYRYDISTMAPDSMQLKAVKQTNGSIVLEHSVKCPQHKAQRRNQNRNRRKKRNSSSNNHFTDGDECSDKSRNKPKYRTPIDTIGNATECSSLLSDEQTAHEPLHMTLDEVKQFYHTLYSDANTKTSTRAVHSCKANQATTKLSNETIWSVSTNNTNTTTTTTTTATTRARCNFGTKDKSAAANAKSNNSSSTTTTNNTSSKGTQKLTSDNDKLNNNNNNNISTLSNQNNQNQCVVVGGGTTHQQQQQQSVATNNKHTLHSEKKSQFTLNLKQKFCSIFRFRRNHNRCRNSNATELEENLANRELGGGGNLTQLAEDKRKKFQSRALPPLPKKVEAKTEETDESQEKKIEPQRSFQFTSSIEKVKDYGWYWGPLSSEAAEKVLSNEPDGSFIVRDSSDDHYIFSLSFKLNNCVRHVRIEQDQGTFSFGSYAKFKSQTITEFIEKAVEHSRSGRYLFFLHRRPEHGPMRVQLTNPVSRFKHVQSLQHMCRFVILKAVIRKDLIQTLPLPRRLLDYLNYKHCYSEQVESDSSHSQMSEEGSV